MNLDQIRDKIKNISDYSPELQAYSNQLDDIINSAYFELWRSKRWTFAEKLSWLEAYPDITAARATSGTVASYNDGQRLVTFSAAIPVLYNRRDIYEGNIIELQSREYTILQVLSTTQLVTSEPIRLETSVGSQVTDDDSFVIKARFYTLPEDCIEILSLTQKDVPMGNGGNGAILPPYGKVYGILAGQDERLGLREDYSASWAECYIPVPPVVVPPGQTLSASTQQQEVGPVTYLPQGEYYEICWSFQSPEKQYGPLSESKIVQIPVDPGAPTATYTLTLTFQTFDGQTIASENTSYSSGPGAKRQWEALQKVVWYNANFDRSTGQRLGTPEWRALTVGIAGTSPAVNINTQDDIKIALDTQGTMLIENADSFQSGSKIYQEWDGQHQRIRPYPRIDAYDQVYPEATVGATTPKRLEDYFRRIELRYSYKPRRLALKTDTPELPYEFHDLIVYKALEDIFNKSGNVGLASYYETKYMKQVEQLEGRYINKVDIHIQRGQFAPAEGGYLFDKNSLANSGQFS